MILARTGAIPIIVNFIHQRPEMLITDANKMGTEQDATQMYADGNYHCDVLSMIQSIPY